MILPQKTMVTLANFVPQTPHALKLVKGTGKKKSEKFGTELLDIIMSYCRKENVEPPEIIPVERKKVKKPKQETKAISYDLFREGKTIEQIAEERKLSVGTIEEHLAFYVETGEIPVGKFVSQEITDLITGLLRRNGDFKMGPVKEALGDKVSWSDIRFVINHLNYLRKQAENDIY